MSGYEHDIGAGVGAEDGDELDGAMSCGEKDQGTHDELRKAVSGGEHDQGVGVDTNHGYETQD